MNKGASLPASATSGTTAGAAHPGAEAATPELAADCVAGADRYHDMQHHR